jgi:hypothetical protein
MSVKLEDFLKTLPENERATIENRRKEILSREQEERKLLENEKEKIKLFDPRSREGI